VTRSFTQTTDSASFRASKRKQSSVPPAVSTICAWWRTRRLFSLLGDGKIDNHQNWKGRFKDNSDRMRTGSIYDVVEVLKSLTFLARSKNLSFREKRMLDRAKFLVISEISEVSREKSDSVEAKVDSALERCFTMKNRSIARAKAAKAAPTTRVSARRTAKAS
jgi:hypothetical protein